MSTTTAKMSIPMIPTGEGENTGNKAVEMKKGQALPLSFINTDIITRLVYDDM